MRILNFACVLKFLQINFPLSTALRGCESWSHRQTFSYPKMARCNIEHSQGVELWFENERLRLFNVMIKPGQAIQWKGLNPSVRWVVGDSLFSEMRYIVH
jgi:hypothetical protein